MRKKIILKKSKINKLDRLKKEVGNIKESKAHKTTNKEVFMGKMVLSECFRWYKKRATDAPVLQVKQTISHLDNHGQGIYEVKWLDVPFVDEEKEG